MPTLMTLFRRLFLFNRKDSYCSLTKYSGMRGTRSACGRSVHGISSPDGSANLCPACRRPGSSDHLQRGWQHIGTGPYWGSLAEWAAAAAGVWPHHRDVMKEPLQPNECICSRQDCVSGLYQMFVRKQRQALTEGSTAVMKRWQVICRCERCFNL